MSILESRNLELRSPETQPGAGEFPRRAFWMGARYLGLLLMVLVLAYRARLAQIDDALIYGRYIQNALAGKGFVFNAGEHVNALTSPLFSYVLLSVSWLLHGRVLLASVVVSCIFLFLASALAERMVPFAGFFVASTAYFYVQVGMETALFLFMLVLAVTLFVEGRLHWLPSVLALLVLTRFEGGLLLLVLCWWFYRSRRWPSPLSYLPAVAIAILYLALNDYVYGQVLPSSASAKIGQGLSGALGPWPTAFFGHAYQLKGDFKPTLYIVLVAPLLACLGVRSARGTRWNAAILPFCGLLLAFYVLFNIPGYRWYFAPFIFFGLLYSARGLPRTRIAYGLATLAIAAAASTNFYVVNRFNSKPTDGYRVLAAWLNQNSAPGARIEAVETGTLGFYCDRYIYDVMGLTTPKNAAHITHGDWHSWIAEDRPDYIVMHSPASAWEQVAAQDPNYEPTSFDYDSILVLRRRPGR